MTRARVISGVTVVGVLLVAGVVLAARSVPATCSYAVPPANLPASLRAEGGFDEPLSASDTASIAQLAQLAATSTSPGLIGAKPVAAVDVAAPDAKHAPAVVVPLQITLAGATQVAGLSIFLRDCDGRLHYSTTESLGSTRPVSFPAVSQSAATARLGPDAVLTYTTDPGHPEWRAPGGATLPAL